MTHEFGIDMLLHGEADAEIGHEVPGTGTPTISQTLSGSRIETQPTPSPWARAASQKVCNRRDTTE